MKWISFSRDLPAVLAMDPVCDEGFYRQWWQRRTTTVQKITSEFTKKPVGVIVFSSLPHRYEVVRLVTNGWTVVFERLVLSVVAKFNHNPDRERLLLRMYETPYIQRDLSQQLVLKKLGFVVSGQTKDEYGVYYEFEYASNQKQKNG